MTLKGNTLSDYLDTLVTNMLIYELFFSLCIHMNHNAHIFQPMFLLQVRPTYHTCCSTCYKAYNPTSCLACKPETF